MVFTHLNVYGNYGGQVFGEPPMENMWLSIAFVAAHVVTFLVIAHLVFKKRDVF